MVLTMARPKIEINWTTVNNMCAIHCTGEEIASVIGVSYDTIERRVKSEFKMSFADYIKKNSANGKMSLRRKQYETAMSGNTTMLVWLGKQYLGQTDKQVVDNTSSDGSMSPNLKIEFINASDTGIGQV